MHIVTAASNKTTLTGDRADSNPCVMIKFGITCIFLIAKCMKFKRLEFKYNPNNKGKAAYLWFVFATDMWNCLQAAS